jgi:cellulose synthase operon protein YhjQ
MTMVCFTSPKGGVGKTTLAANIAGELSRASMRVIALDIDPQNALRLHFGVPLEESTGFTHRIAQQPEWRSCLLETPAGVPLLAYGPASMWETINLGAAVANDPDLLRRAVDPLLEMPGICLVVDAPPGHSPMLAALLPRVDLMVTVLTPDAGSMSLIPALEHAGLTGDPAELPEATRFILNQFDPRTRLGGVIADAAARHLGNRILGVVYRDEHVAEAIAAQKLLADYAPGSKAYQDIRAVGQAIRAHLQAPVTA